jgi:hypothetical protein
MVRLARRTFTPSLPMTTGFAWDASTTSLDVRFRRLPLWAREACAIAKAKISLRAPGSNGFDALIVGFYQRKDLLFAARVRAGFVAATRREVFSKIKHMKTPKCPFANLPESSPGRWGQGLTAEKMKVRGTAACRSLDSRMD